MAPNLIPLLTRYKNVKDFESEVALFRTNTPHRAPFAYLHILYKPAPETLRRLRCQQLKMPPGLAGFYALHNGAELFGGTIRIFGFLPEFYLLNRRDWQNLPPFNILDLNAQYKKELVARNLVLFADYGYDGSLVCVERDSERVRCFVGDSFRGERKSWPDVDTWLHSEIERLTKYFDELGQRSTDDERLLPDE